ncbi:uncharacterized protein K460DRAFT_405684 [Cucurbitaria berberidis CBS 394.84]|uniref:Uncharacterized protein n=1 Tax=Cucurbitaria berberidis CBS 394.84 TaxID=1168544 RepID=A0A9P4L8J7_9PLEO|nr:uncharacterized protein K460DRAFT_405684 [Cucurbitaria berberidis CBS 394.84]KAF1845422.1 hypothetical protein K460DRAFT_405684 [Cucurbitaria berberidis CBS 394.84]
MEMQTGPQDPKVAFKPTSLWPRRKHATIDRSTFDAPHTLQNESLLVKKAFTAYDNVHAGRSTDGSRPHRQTQILTKKEDDIRRKSCKDLETKLHYTLQLFAKTDDLSKCDYKELAKRWESIVWRVTQTEDGDIDEYMNNIDLDLHDIDEWDSTWSEGNGREMLSDRIYQLLPEDFAQSRSLPQQKTTVTSPPKMRFVPKVPKTRKRNNKVDTSEFKTPEYIPLDQDQVFRDAAAAAAKVKEATLNAERYRKGQLSTEDEKRRQNRRQFREAISTLIELLPKTDALAKLDGADLAASRETSIWEETFNNAQEISAYDDKILDELQDLDTWNTYWESEDADEGGGRTGCTMFRQYVLQHSSQELNVVVQEDCLNEPVPQAKQSEMSKEDHERTEARNQFEWVIEDLVKCYVNDDEMARIDVPKLAAAWELQSWNATCAKTFNIADYLDHVENERVEIVSYSELWEDRLYNGLTGQEAFRQHFDQHFGAAYLIPESTSPELNDELYDLAGGNENEDYDKNEEDDIASGSYHKADSDVSNSLWDDELYDLAGGNENEHYDEEEDDIASGSHYKADSDVSDDELYELGGGNDYNIDVSNNLLEDEHEIIESPASPSSSQRGFDGIPIVEDIEGEINEDNAPHYSFGAALPLPLSAPQDRGDDVRSEFSYSNSYLGDNAETNGFEGEKLQNGSFETFASDSQDLGGPPYNSNMNSLLSDQNQFSNIRPKSHIPPDTEQDDIMDFEHHLTETIIQADKPGAHSADEYKKLPLQSASLVAESHDQGVKDVAMPDLHVSTIADTSSSNIGSKISSESGADTEMSTSPETRTPVESSGLMFSTAGMTFGKPFMGSTTSFLSRTTIDFGVNTANLSTLKREPAVPQVDSQESIGMSQTTEADQGPSSATESKPVDENVGVSENDEVAEDVQETSPGVAQNTIEATVYMVEDDICAHGLVPAHETDTDDPKVFDETDDNPTSSESPPTVDHAGASDTRIEAVKASQTLEFSPSQMACIMKHISSLHEDLVTRINDVGKKFESVRESLPEDQRDEQDPIFSEIKQDVGSFGSLSPQAAMSMLVEIPEMSKKPSQEPAHEVLTIETTTAEMVAQPTISQDVPEIETTKNIVDIRMEPPSENFAEETGKETISPANMHKQKGQPTEAVQPLAQKPKKKKSKKQPKKKIHISEAPVVIDQEVSEVNKLCSRITTYQTEWELVLAMKGVSVPRVFIDSAEDLVNAYRNMDKTDSATKRRLSELINHWDRLRRTVDAFHHLFLCFSNQAQDSLRQAAKDFRENMSGKQGYTTTAIRYREAGEERLAERWEALAAGRAQAHEKLLELAKPDLDVLVDRYREYYDAIQDLYMWGVFALPTKSIGEMASWTLADYRGRIKEAHKAFDTPLEELSVDICDCEL